MTLKIAVRPAENANSYGTRVWGKVLVWPKTYNTNSGMWPFG